MLIVGLLSALVPAGFGVLLLIAGQRGGDRAGELTIAGVEAGVGGCALSVRLRNPGGVAVVVGLSVARAGLRLWAEGGLMVRVPRRTSTRGLLATRHAVLGVVPAAGSATFEVPLPPGQRARVALVVCAGERDRLRVIYRLVTARLDAARPSTVGAFPGAQADIGLPDGYARSERSDRSHR